MGDVGNIFSFVIYVLTWGSIRLINTSKKAKRNPQKEYPVISKPKKVEVGTRRKIILKFQHKLFAPNEFWNSNSNLQFLVQGRDSQIWRSRFPLLVCSIFFWYKKVESRQTFYILKNSASYPCINLLIHCFFPFYPWSKFPRTPDYPRWREIF